MGEQMMMLALSKRTHDNRCSGSGTGSGAMANHGSSDRLQRRQNLNAVKDHRRTALLSSANDMHI